MRTATSRPCGRGVFGGIPGALGAAAAARRRLALLLAVPLAAASPAAFGRSVPALPAAVPAAPAAATTPATPPAEASVEGYLAELSLEELMEIEVISVTRSGGRRWQTPAAVHVLTAADLRRSGVTTIAEALRLVPGMQVARIDSSRWAISARGFNNRFANKLLILMDGRSLYTPAFSGVFWDVQDTLIEDIERIEVFRGPGGTQWGSNAVNGVINIITKPAAETQGALASVLVGEEERLSAAYRLGGRTGERGAWRFWAKSVDRDHFVQIDNEPANDAWSMLRGGFRIDWDARTHGGGFSLLGDVYEGTTDQTSVSLTGVPPYSESRRFGGDVSGGDLVAHWRREFDSAGELSVRAIYDRRERDLDFILKKLQVWDLDVHHGFRIGRRHALSWGIGYRLYDDEFEGTPQGMSDDNPDDVVLWNAFVQDEISFAGGRTRLIVGTKLEHNTYTHNELQPSARFAWHPDEDTTVWVAASRGVRIPSRASRNFTVDLAPAPGAPIVPRLLPDEGVDSEELTAWEAGWRSRLNPRVSVDLALFHNEYDRLETTDADTPFLEFSPPPPKLVVPLTLGNGGEGEASGAELSVDFRPLPRWRLQAGVTWLDLDLELKPGFEDSTFRDSESENPEHSAFLISSFDAPHNVEIDATLRFVDELPDQPGTVATRSAVDHYTTMDVRIGWHPREAVMLELAGRNLLEGRHLEFIDLTLGTPPTAVERGVFVRATWRY